MCHTEFQNYIRKLNFAPGSYSFCRANANIYGFVRRENVEFLCLWQELLCFFLPFLDEKFSINWYSVIRLRTHSSHIEQSLWVNIWSKIFSNIAKPHSLYFLCGFVYNSTLLSSPENVYSDIFVIYSFVHYVRRIHYIIYMMSMYVCVRVMLNGWKLQFYAYFIKINKWKRNKSSVCQIESVLCENEWASYYFSYLTTYLQFTINQLMRQQYKKKRENLQHSHQSRMRIQIDRVKRNKA